jgi:hypothetical protein
MSPAFIKGVTDHCQRPRLPSTSSMWSLIRAKPWTRCGAPSRESR